MGLGKWRMDWISVLRSFKAPAVISPENAYFKNGIYCVAIKLVTSIALVDR